MNKPTLDELKMLQDPKLLLRIIREIKQEGIMGEEDSMICIIIKMMLRLVNNAKASSSNLIVSDASGSGKDIIVKTIGQTIISPDKYYHRTDLSDKVLDYWQPSKEGWDGCVLSIEDPREEFLQSQSLKVFASGGTRVTKVVEHKAKDTLIKGKPVLIITSLKATINDEGMRRWDSIQLDLSEKLTKKVIQNVLLKRSGNIKYEPDIPFRLAIQQQLKRHNVTVPCAETLNEVLPITLATRTQVNKLIDYISSSAILHQYQRKKDEHENIIANLYDFEVGYFVFTRLNSANACPLNKSEKELIAIIINAGEPIPVRDIISQLQGHGKKWFYENLESFKSKGLIQEKTDFDNKSNREITFYYAPRDLNLDIDLNHSDMVRLVSDCFDLDYYQKTTEFSEENETKNVVVTLFSELCKQLDNDRNTMGLPSIFLYIYKNGNNHNNTTDSIEEKQSSSDIEKNREQPEITETTKTNNENKQTRLAIPYKSPSENRKKCYICGKYKNRDMAIRIGKNGREYACIKCLG